MYNKMEANINALYTGQIFYFADDELEVPYKLINIVQGSSILGKEYDEDFRNYCNVKYRRYGRENVFTGEFPKTLTVLIEG